MMVTIESFVITSSTSGVVSWLPLDEIHHNDETISYNIARTNLNSSDASVESFSTVETAYNFTGTLVYIQRLGSAGC